MILTGAQAADRSLLMIAGKKIIVIMPAYNAARTLKKTYDDIPKDLVDRIILVDDVSQDNTVEIAESLGLKVIVHIQNKGYGGNQKTCYIEALKEGADVVVMLHPDHQYDSKLVPELVRPIIEGVADMVMGSRMLDGRALEGGMPLYKFIANKFLTGVENLTLGLKMTDLHSGFRAYSRELLETVPFLLNSDDFVFDSEMIAQAAAFGFRLAEIPVRARYFKEASSVNFKVSTIYGFKTLFTLLKYLLHKLGIVRQRQFEKRLVEVISRHHHPSIFRERSALQVSPSSPDGRAERES